MIILNILLLIVGLVMLIKGADFFVDGSSSIARSMKVPSLIIGLTLVSIGTSAPELSVSITSALAKSNDICFGNVIGSNVFNTFIVIGVSSLFVNLSVSKEMKFFDLPILLCIYTVLGFFTFVLTPGIIDFWEALIFIALFITYLLFLIFRTKKASHNDEEPEVKKERKWYLNVLFVALGLLMIIYGGDLVVNNASELAEACGMSKLLVGLTVIAIGTSLPELVTSIVAAKKGEHDMAVGNAVGSSLFNIMLILGSSAVINPISIELSSAIDLAAMILAALLVWIFSMKENKINKWQGSVLIALYVAYMIYVVVRGLS